MATHKDSLSKVSINQLCQLTGSSYRTIKKRLSRLDPISEDGRTLFFDPKRALPMIYGPAISADEDPLDAMVLDPVRQSARLAKARADKTELEIKILKREMIPAPEVETEWSALVIAFRAKMLTISSKAAQTITAAGKKDFHVVKGCIDELIYEALNELKDYEPSDGQSDSVGDVESGTAAEIDRNSMG